MHAHGQGLCDDKRPMSLNIVGAADGWMLTAPLMTRRQTTSSLAGAANNKQALRQTDIFGRQTSKVRHLLLPDY